jgi:hypothetical protein
MGRKPSRRVDYRNAPSKTTVVIWVIRIRKEKQIGQKEGEVKAFSGKSWHLRQKIET